MKDWKEAPPINTSDAIRSGNTMNDMSTTQEIEKAVDALFSKNYEMGDIQEWTENARYALTHIAEVAKRERDEELREKIQTAIKDTQTTENLTARMFEILVHTLALPASNEREV